MTTTEIKELKQMAGILKAEYPGYSKILYKLVEKYDKKTISERKEKFKINIKNLPERVNFDCNMVSEFIDYWTECGENDRKMRFEKEKSFDISRRLKTWQRNSKKFNKQPTQTEINDLKNMNAL
jgi:hypothetical protein